MSRIAYCPACAAHEHGVKTRVALEHTCGLERGEIRRLEEPDYRGPNSHCKACEDEANGVKHIMAQKHTCR